MFTYKLLLAGLFVLIFPYAQAQTISLNNFQELSHSFYEKQKDSLKKAWACPSIFKEKETQKKYKEIWEGRTDFITGVIAEDNFVYDKVVFEYVESIVQQIVQANGQMVRTKPFLLIDRSSSVNAYAIGGNIIAVNLGLISFSRTREELALAIAHELSHNILEHPENAMKQKAEWLTSDEYKESLDAILDSKYQRLSRLKNVFSGYSFSRSRHQRYHEGDADSLAIELLKKSNISFDPSYFLRLDSVDVPYKQTLKAPLKDYLAAYNLPFEAAWAQKRSRGLSTRNYNFRDTTVTQDSLKTHPDCAERYARNKNAASPVITQTPIPASVRERATRMIIWNIYRNRAFTACLYRILLEKDKGNNNEWYDFMVHNIFTGLYHADKELSRFNVIGVTQKEFISKDYYELQTMLEQMPRESLEKYCRSLQSAGFWTKLTPQEVALKSFLYTLALDTDQTDKNRTKAAREFSTGHPTSLYCEITMPYEKKK